LANLLLMISDTAMCELARRLLVADGHEVSVAGRLTPELAGAADALIVEDALLEATMRRLPVAIVTVGRELRADSALAALRLQALDYRLLPDDSQPFLASVRRAAGHTRELRRNSAELSTLKERLAMLLVHDLKTPLSVVKTNLELLNQTAAFGADERAEMVADALAATDRLLGMIMDLLDISRSEEGRLSLDPLETPLSAVVSEVVLRHRHLAGVRQIEVELEVPAELEARVDVKLFQRVIENILANSLRYAPDHGLVRIGAASSGSEVALYIENDGPTIPVAVRQRLFEKYGQIDIQESRQRYENRGLGLYFCRLVIEAHGGAITVTERDGGGARFEIRLPRPQRRLPEAQAGVSAKAPLGRT
jgi:signal transduction histidine kinase